MMTDVFVEYMVKKKTGSKDVLMSLGVSILGAILIFVSIFIATPRQHSNHQCCENE